jgi:hypothetical protein
MKIVRHGTLQVADSHGTHGRLDTRTSRYAIAAPFLDRRSRRGRLGREMLAIAWLTALGEETEKGRGGGSFLVP